MFNHINLTSGSKPVRKSGIIIMRDGDDTVLRFPYTGNGLRLNQSAIIVWQFCDGTRNFAEICNEIAGLAIEGEGSVESAVSDTVSSLISAGLIELNRAAPNPVLTIAFSGYPENFKIANNYFLNLFVNWFDLLVVEPDEEAEILVSWSSSDTKYHMDNVVLHCLVDSRCEENLQMYDLVFRHKDCEAEAERNTLKLPEDFLLNPIPPLDNTDRSLLDSMFSRKTPDDALNQRVKKKLTIGMATYDDYDGVYFTVQAIRMYHSEVTDETEILVIDNNPGGACSNALRNLKNSVPGYRYVAKDVIKGTAVRDFVFHEATSDYVMCIDSHIFIEPGAIRKLIDYFDDHPGTPDLLQGPLVYDNLKDIATHFEPVWRQGMFGVWNCDERGRDPAGQPFDIPMQGLGLAACLKDAWQGYNRRFSGFGGEEGYIHQKFRNAGARTLCLPFLRWTHRFDRPMGSQYANIWEDRIRNYLIGFDEVGLDTRQALDHFSQEVNEERTRKVARLVELEKDNPFDFFDAIYCINLDSDSVRWSNALKRFEKLGIRYRVQRYSAIETPESHHIGCALSHRQVVAEAKEKGYENILVFEDDVIFHVDALEHLGKSVSELKQQRWFVFYLGGMKWMKLGRKPYKKIPGCEFLDRPEGMTCTHAVAYHSSFYDKLLADIPHTMEGLENWIRDSYAAIDQYLPSQDHLVVMSPVIASQPALLEEEDEAMRAGFA